MHGSGGRGEVKPLRDAAPDMNLPFCFFRGVQSKWGGGYHEPEMLLLTFSAKDTVMMVAQIAMPIKPTRWRVRRPARSTRKSCRMRRGHIGLPWAAELSATVGTDARQCSKNSP